MSKKTTIFTIYALEDKDVMLHLLHQLKPLEADFNTVIWSDDPVNPGQPWKPKNDSRLDQADIFLLLISDIFMHSSFIQQLEFKKVIDRYKAGDSTVIPIIIDACPWDIDFNSEDYDFNFRELHVMPEDEKPLSDWDSPEQAYNQIATYIKSVISPIAKSSIPNEATKELEKEVQKTKAEEQLAIRFAEEEAEVKRKAEVKRNKEEEGKRLETEAKQKAEVQKKLLEEAEAKSNAEQKKRLIEEAEANTKAVERKKLDEKAKAERKGEEERKWAEEQKRLLEKAEIKSKGEREKRLMEATESKVKAEKERNQIAEANADQNAKLATEANTELEEKLPEQSKNSSKRILKGILIAVLAVALLWAFSLFTKEDAEEIASPVIVTDTLAVEDAVISKKPETEPEKIEEPFVKLAIGDTYNGGIVFEIEATGKKGRIAHVEDAGPMTWKDAMEIDTKLGEGWRLPTFEELRAMYKTIGQGDTNNGKFADEFYWSATPFDASQARVLRFRDGNTSYHYNSKGTHRKFRVRAVRDFSR